MNRCTKHPKSDFHVSQNKLNPTWKPKRECKECRRERDRNRYKTSPRPSRAKQGCTWQDVYYLWLTFCEDRGIPWDTTKA